MEKIIVNGGKPLQGEIAVSGAKNVAMKAIIATLLTEETVRIKNIPLISSVLGTARIITSLGAKVDRTDHELTISSQNVNSYQVPLELGGLYRTATMTIGPLLARFGRAIVPNPGGCRLGKRPVDWHIRALEKMGAMITYKDGYFIAEAKRLHSTTIEFAKNTHTGTETVLLAAVMAEGETVIENAAAEPEVDDLIQMLNTMGAKIKRLKERTIVISGVNQLHGTEYTIMPDRNEVVTFAIAAAATGGDVLVKGTERNYLTAFLLALDKANVGWEAVSADSTRFFVKGPIKPTDIVTGPYPAFMTDWQQPWAVLATQARGTSRIHETVFEHRFSYVSELMKMGAKIKFYHPRVSNPDTFYNFNWQDRIPGYYQGVKIFGPTKLHDAILEMTDIRAGATLLVAALAASGTSVLTEVEHLDRGYEKLDVRLHALGAAIKRIKEEL